MKLCKHYKKFEELAEKENEAQRILRFVDGTNRDNDKIIDNACTILEQSKKIRWSYWLMARTENITLEKTEHIPIKTTLSKWDFIKRASSWLIDNKNKKYRRV